MHTGQYTAVEGTFALDKASDHSAFRRQDIGLGIDFAAADAVAVEGGTSELTATRFVPGRRVHCSE
jgi:hypothetical protein